MFSARVKMVPVLLAALLLSACGFTPMYGSSAAASRHQVQATLNNIAIASIPDREGQYLRNRLIDRFHGDGTPQNAAYHLTVSPVSETKLDLDTTKNANATRAELTLRTSFTLTDRASGAALLSRNLAAITSYNILTSQFTTRVSEDNARLNALEDLARQIEQQIVLYFERQGKVSGGQ